MGSLAILFLYLLIAAFVALILYFVIKKAVKDAILETRK